MLSFHLPSRPRLPARAAATLFLLTAATALLAGCDNGTPTDEASAGGGATVSFSTAGLSVLEEDRPSLELPVQIHTPGGSEVTVEVLFAQAASSETFTLADLGVTSADEEHLYRGEDGDTTAYVVGTVTFGPDAADGDTQAVTVEIADEVVEDQETGVFALQKVTGGVGYAEPRELEVTVEAEGTVTFVSEDFTSEDGEGTLGAFTPYSVTSSANWAPGASGEASNRPYAVINGYGADAPSNDWLISPAFDFASTEGEILSFLNAKNFDDAGLERGLQVLVSTDYDGEGNPEDFAWTDVSDRVAAFSEGSYAFASSGDVDLSDDAFQSGATHVAFRYRTSGTGGGTTEAWEVDTIVVTGRDAGE